MDIHWHFWHHGDPTVGDYGNSAEIKMTISDGLGMIQHTKNALIEAFKDIWDTNRVIVMTDEEINKED